MSETFQSHDLHTPYSSQMLSDLHLCDTSGVTVFPHTDSNYCRSTNKYINGKINVVNVSNSSSLTSLSPFMSSPELSPFLTSPESSLPTDYAWHEENIPRFQYSVPEFQDIWHLNKHTGIILTTESVHDDHYNNIPQFDGTSDEPSSSHQKANQNHIPPVTSQHADCLQSSRESSEHRSSSETEHPFGMSWNTGAAGRRTQPDQKWSTQRHQWFNHQQNMPTLLPSSPAASIQSPTHNPHASPSQQQALQTPSPPHLQPQSPAYSSALTNKSQHSYQSPSHYPYQSPQSNWGFHSSHQPYKSPSASQSYQPLGETSESCQLEPAHKSYQSPRGSEVQGLHESPYSSYQSPQRKVYQGDRDQMQPSIYQSSSQSHEGFQSERYPQPFNTLREDACDPDQSVWGPHSANFQGKIDTHNLKSSQNSASSLGKSHLKVHYSSNDPQTVTSGCDFSQPGSHNYRFPQDFRDKPSVTPPFCQSSTTGVAHISAKQLKSLHHLVSLVGKQSSVRSSGNLGNIAESSKLSIETAGTLSSSPPPGQFLIEDPGEINTRRDNQTDFIKKIIDSPTPPMPGRRYRDRVKQDVELLGRSRSTSLSSPVSPVIEHYRCHPERNVSSPVVGQPGVSQSDPRTHRLSSESRMPSPMHSSDWQYWKEQNFPPGCQWQEWKMHEQQNFDSSENVSGSRLQHTSSSVNSAQSSSYISRPQPNTMSLFTDTQNALQNKLRQSLQVHLSADHIFTSKIKKSKGLSSSSLHHLVPHVDSDGVHQQRALASSVPVSVHNRSGSKVTAHMPILSGSSTRTDSINVKTHSINVKTDSINVKTHYNQESERTGSEPAEKYNVDLDDFSYLKPENISRSNSLESIHFQDGKQDVNNKEAAKPNVDSGNCGDESSPAYTVTFQVPTTSLKNLSHPSFADTRTDNVEKVRMRPGDVHSNSLLKIGCEVVKAVKLNEVDLEDYVDGEPSQPGILPSDGSAAQRELDTLVVDVNKHNVDDRRAAMTSTFNTDFLQNTKPGQHSMNNNASVSRASKEMNCRSPVDSEWMYQHTDQHLGKHKQEIIIGTMQSEDSQEENLSCRNKFKRITSLCDVSPDGRNRPPDSQLPGNDSGRNRKQDSSCVHSVPSSIENKCYARQEKDVYKSHLLQQKQHHHGHQQPQPHEPYLHQLQPHAMGSHPGLQDLQPTDQHRLANSCSKRNLSRDTCDDRENHENNVSSRFDLQMNEAHGSSRTTGQQRDAWSTLKQSVLGHLPSARHGSSTFSKVHTKHSRGVGQLDEMYTSRTDQLEHAGKSCSSSPAGYEEDRDGTAYKKCSGNNALEHPGQQLNEIGEQRMKLSSRKNVKALCLTIPKSHSHVSPLDLDRRNTSSDDTEQSSAFSSLRGLDDSESNSKDKFTFHRSRRCSRVEEGNIDAEGKHSPQKAKMQSVHSKSAHILKLKKRKTAESLIEGVHYVVVGKFRGHKVMLVKTKKLNVTPSESVKVGDFEKLAAKEIVRVVSPVSRMCAGDAEASTYLCDISESDSDTCSHKPRVVCNNFSVDPALARTPKVLAATVAISEINTGKDEFKSDRFRSGTESKNIFTSLTKEFGGDSEWSRRLKGDQFFFRFKESFIKHCKGKEDISDSQLEDHENIFFEGVKRSSFCIFQQKFLSNIQKLKSGDYSSSSDDEDDVLDETILKKSIGSSNKPIISQVKNSFTPQRSEKHGYSAGEGHLGIDHPDVKHSDCTLYDQNNKSRDYVDSPRIAENGQEKWLYDSKLGSYFATNTGINANTEQFNKCTAWVDRFNEGVEADKNRQLLKDYESGEYMGSTLREYESEKYVGSTLKEHESDKNSGSRLKEYWNEKHSGITIKEYDSEKHSGSKIKEYDSEKHSGSTLKMESTNSSVETNMEQSSNIYQHNYNDKPSISNSTHVEEAREDYLKCQMAFFEDISSDSESNDTIIMDTCTGKGNTLQRDSTAMYSSFSVPDPCPGQVSEIRNIPTQKSTSPTSSCELKLKEHVEHHDQRCDNMKQQEVCESMQRQAQICTAGNEHGLVAGTSDRTLTQVSIASSEFTHVFKLTSQQKDNENNLSSSEMLEVSQGVFIKQGHSLSTSMGYSDTEVEVGKCKVTHSNESGTMNVPTEPRPDVPSVFLKIHHKKKRRRKSVKKIKNVQASSGPIDRQIFEDGSSSCHNEIDVSVVPDCPSKSLPERKKTYTYYTEDLDSDEDISSDSSDEDFTVCSSRRKGVKISRKSKGRNPEEKPIRKLARVNVDSGRTTKRGQKASTSRGRKKKAAGGDKLLSSLSLLHMATLANLTDTPSDLPDHQSVSEAAMYMLDDSHTLYYTDNSLSSAPDEMLPYSSQYSKEEDPPFLDNKQWKHTRKRKCAKESTALSKKLLKRQTNLKYGHNVPSDTGRNSASLSRLVNNCSSSPVPSNFTFSQISDISGQAEAAQLYEDAGTNITLQLLETRRAQVNCASFSMKDILRLTTPDDSMDSDSRDSSAHVRFSATKKAQVNSTALSMSDILKLTDIGSHSETGHISTSGHVLLSNSGLPISQPEDNSDDILEPTVSRPSSKISREAVVTSCAVHPETAHFVNSSRTQTPTSELSGCVRLHLKQLDGVSHQKHTTNSQSSATDLLQPADYQHSVPEVCAQDSSIEAVSGALVQGTTSYVQADREAHNKSVLNSDSIQVDTVEILSNREKAKVSDTSRSLGNMNNKHAENDSEFKTYVNRLENESHKRVGSSSSSSAFISSSVLHRTVNVKPTLVTSTSSALNRTFDVKPALETSTSSELNRTVKEIHTTSLSTLPHSSHLIIKTLSTSKQHRDRGEEEDSENVATSHRIKFTTTGTDLEVTGVSSPSVEECDQLNYDAIPTTPSQIVLEASVPGTSISPVVKTARLSGASGRAFSSQKVSCSSSEPLTTFSKQENKGNHKNMNVRNTDRGIKPLHPLQIPHYSLADQNCHPHIEHVHNKKSSSVYYPHCWQWPVHTPGSDSTVSPLNLCTSHKSPNNYSPITPTSPVSPDYPTQAQGVTEFDKSPRVKEGKPLWYPWLKVEPDRSQTTVSNAQTSHYSSEEYRMQSVRNTTRLQDLLPVKQSEQEEAANVFREPAQVDSHRVKHDVKTNLDLQKQSTSKSKDQFSTASKSSFVKPRGVLLNAEAAVCPGTPVDASCGTGGESLPSAGCSETLAGAELKAPFEISTAAALNIKWSST